MVYGECITPSLVPPGRARWHKHTQVGVTKEDIVLPVPSELASLETQFISLARNK